MKWSLLRPTKGYEGQAPTKVHSAPSNWIKNYPSASFTVITPENYLDYVLNT